MTSNVNDRFTEKTTNTILQDVSKHLDNLQKAIISPLNFQKYRDPGRQIHYKYHVYGIVPCLLNDDIAR
jgi:hypothetical protein